LSQDAKQIEKYRGIIKFLDNAVKNIALYPPEHPSVKGVAKRAFDLLGEVLEVVPQVIVRVVNGVLCVDDYIFSEPTPYSESFLKVLSAFEIDELFFRKGVSEEEFLKLAGILKSKERGREVFLGLSEREGLTHIGLKSDAPGPADGARPVGRRQTRQDAVNSMERFFAEVGEGRFPSLREAENIVESLMEKTAAEGPSSMLLSCEKGYDSYTFGHCVNVGVLSLLLAQKEGLGEPSVQWAALAGLMHDIGKARIPFGIIQKPGVLTPRESEAMRLHPVHSAEVVRRMGAAEEVAVAVEGHHRHHDGGGYPAGERNEGPPVLAGLVLVADFFDAATTVRSYQRPMNPVEAMNYLKKGRGSRFDPVHVDAFFGLFGQFPPGSVIRLSSNEIGVVVKTGDHPGKPSVKMILDRDGDPFGNKRILDLDGPEAAGRVVSGVVDPALYGLELSSAFPTGPHAEPGP